MSTDSQPVLDRLISLQIKVYKEIKFLGGLMVPEANDDEIEEYAIERFIVLMKSVMRNLPTETTANDRRQEIADALIAGGLTRDTSQDIAECLYLLP